MAIKDTTKKPYIIDRDDKIFVGIDLPFRKSEGRDGWFTSTTTTIEAVKNNIKNLLQTQKGERFMQPFLGINLRRYIFEPVDDDVTIKIQNDIMDTFKYWLPFVEIRDMRIDTKEIEERNILSIYISFNIKQDPNTLESIQVTIGE
tara:strand:- start:2572 stop:3009 length:438 start_codon:yes stop_codon:yes gene_type:complete